MKKIICTFAFFALLMFALPLHATLVSGGGLYVRSTSATLGHILPTQTLVFDLIRAYRADSEISLIDLDTNQIIAQFGSRWDFITETGSETFGGAYDPAVVNVTLDHGYGYDTAVLTHIPEGNYRVTLDALAPDYYPGSYREETYGYFNSYGTSGMGFVGIDMGANYESYVAVDIILDNY